MFKIFQTFTFKEKIPQKTLDCGTKALLNNIYMDLWMCLIIPVLVVMGNANIMRKLYKLKNSFIHTNFELMNRYG